MSQAHSHDSIHDSHETPISALYSSDPTLLARGQRLFRLPPLSTMHSPPDVEEELLSDEVVQSSCFESDMGTAENSSAGTVDVTHPCDMSTVESTTADQVEPNEPADQQIKEIPEELLLSSKKRKPTGSSHSSCLQKLAIRSMTSHSCQSQKASEFENDNTGINSQSPGVRTIEHMSQDNSHYSSTVSTILQCNIVPDLGFIFDNLQRQPQRSAFDNWTCQRDCSTLPMQHVGSPQGLLKNVLCTIPHLYRWFEDQNLLVHKNIEEGAAKCYNSTPQEDPSVNHVLAERKRREKLNEKFLILQSLVPLTKV
ncbi:hypothetical protein Taro_006161, partial [Colocasia esculenta]|nr:hypothetical protein [Colocasia esculenta]